MKLSISHDEHRIFFKREDGSLLGETNYKLEVWTEISSVNWYVKDKDLEERKKTYIYTGSNKFGGYNDLHQIVMILWYGLDRLKQAYKKEFIVEHHDNNAFNCLVENLSFASRDINLAKAHTYDKEKKAALPVVGINFFKDFSTQRYQVTVGFNKPFIINADGELKGITTLFLIYEDDFRTVFQDITNLLYNLVTHHKFQLSKLQHIYMEFEESIYAAFTDGEELPPMVEIDGELMLVLNDENRLVSIAPRKHLYKK